MEVCFWCILQEKVGGGNFHYLISIAEGWKARGYARTGNYTNFYFNVSNPPGSSLPQAIIDLTDGRKIRYVLIPAGIQINTAKIGEKDFLDASTLQQLSYDQVKELFDLEN